MLNLPGQFDDASYWSPSGKGRRAHPRISFRRRRLCGDGAIGYVEYGYAKRVGLPVAALENKEGKFIAPSPEAGAAAINQSSYLGLGNLKASILDPASPGAYPIVSYSWLILRWDYPAEQLKAVNAFVDFILADGQKMALDLGYVPLPAPVAYRGKAALARIFPSEGGGASLGDNPDKIPVRRRRTYLHAQIGSE